MAFLNPYELIDEDSSIPEEGLIEFRESYLFNGLFQFGAFSGLAAVLLLGNWGALNATELLLIGLLPTMLAVQGLCKALRFNVYTFRKGASTLTIRGYKLYPVIPFRKTYDYSDIHLEIRKRFILASPPRFWHCVYLITPVHSIVFAREEAQDLARAASRRLSRKTGVVVADQ